MRFTDLLAKIDPLALADICGGAQQESIADIAASQGIHWSTLKSDIGAVRARRQVLAGISK
jgi:hypothetical protein